MKRDHDEDLTEDDTPRLGSAIPSIIPEREERDRLFAKIAQREPGVIKYQKNTTRILPVVILRRI